MRSQIAFAEAQEMANFLNHPVRGRSGTIYTPGNTTAMAIIPDNPKKRARVEATAARVQVPRDVLADAIDYAGLHVEVLLVLGGDEAVDTFADIWSDAVVMSHEPWGRFGALRRHGWKLCERYLPPLLERSIRHDPHRWVRVGEHTAQGLFALVGWYPKSLDLNGSLKTTITEWISDYDYWSDESEDEADDDESNREPKDRQALIALMSHAERIHYFAEENDPAYDMPPTKFVLDLVLPLAKNLKELFINADSYPSHEHEATVASRTATNWVDRANFLESVTGRGLTDPTMTTIAVEGKNYSLADCIKKIEDNPCIDVKVQINLMYRELLARIPEGRRKPVVPTLEDATLAVEILQALLHTQHLNIMNNNDDWLATWGVGDDGGSLMWEILSDYLQNTDGCSVTIGGVSFDTRDCHGSISLAKPALGWFNFARILYSTGPNATISTKYRQLADFSARALELNYVGCLCCAVYPDEYSVRYPGSRLAPDRWLEIATMLQPGDRIRCLLHPNESQHKPRAFSAFECCEMFCDSAGCETGVNWSHSWREILSVFSLQGDFEATVEGDDWRYYAHYALSVAMDSGDVGRAMIDVVRLIPDDGVMPFDGREHTKAQLYLRALEYGDPTASDVIVRHADVWSSVGALLVDGNTVEHDGATYCQKMCFERSLALNPGEHSVWVKVSMSMQPDELALIGEKTYTQSECDQKSTEETPTL